MDGPTPSIYRSMRIRDFRSGRPSTAPADPSLTDRDSVLARLIAGDPPAYVHPAVVAALSRDPGPILDFPGWHPDVAAVLRDRWPDSDNARRPGVVPPTT
jgi:hypothetical protein